MYFRKLTYNLLLQELVSHCAKAIFHCAEDDLTRTLIRQHNGLEPLVRLIKFTDNVSMLDGVTGAIWKVAIDRENCKVFKDLKLCESLVPLLHSQPEEVMINVAGSIAECAKIPENIEQIRKAGNPGHLCAAQLRTENRERIKVRVGVVSNVARAST